ncbi:MAG: TrkA family potassium uptake protein [Bernardetiaceae bacterium]|nr:TrkA family potassium uptake protein [Bernardetiaceae bacterium]
MPDKFAVIGLGHFGYAVARNLAQRGAEVLAIDRDIERVEAIKDDVAYAVALDATDRKAISTQNLIDMDAVLIAIGENIEGLLLTTVQLLELNVKRIIARAMNDQQRLILNKLGVSEVLSPEDEVGKLVAEMLLNPNMKAFLPLPDEYSISEIQVPRRLINRSIAQAKFIENYEIDLIAIKRVYTENQNNGEVKQVEHLLNRPGQDIVLEHSDMLIVMGKVYNLEKLVELNR